MGHMERESQGGRKHVCEHLGQGPRPASGGPVETEFIAPRAPCLGSRGPLKSGSLLTDSQ